MPNLASLESVVSLGFKAHTFALFAPRRHAKRAQMTRATRNAWRGGRGRGERCTNGRVRSMRRRDAQAMRGPRSARRGGVRVGRRACGWPCARHAVLRCADTIRGLRSARRGVWVGRRACVNGRVRSMRRRDTQAMRRPRSAWLGQCGRIASSAGVPHGTRAWGAAMGHVARRGGALRAARC